MAKALFANNATSTLAAPITAASTTIFLKAGDGALFPAADPNVGSYFTLTLEDRTVSPILREIVKVTNRATDTLTVQRGQEGTTAQSWPSGAQLGNRATAGTLTSLREDAIAGQRYYGTSATVPTTRPDGTARQGGDTYYDSVKRDVFVWGGAAWTSATMGAGDREVGGSLDVVGDLTVGGAAHIEGDTTLDGATTVGSSLSVAGATSLAGGSSTGTMSFETIEVTGEITGSGGIVVDGDVSTTGSVSVGGTLEVSGTSAFGDIVTIDGARVATLADVSGTADYQMLPNGNLIQWGNAVSADPYLDIVFPKEFTTACKMVMVSLIEPMPEGQNVEITTGNWSKTGFRVWLRVVNLDTTVGYVSNGENTSLEATTTVTKTPTAGAPFAWQAVGG